MKLKALVLGSMIGLCSTVFAANTQHTHPQAEQVNDPSVVQRAGNCEIEIINRSYTDVHVEGVFDDGNRLNPFDIYSFEAPHYISLYYYGYCHSGMDLYIDTFDGDAVYSGYTRRKTTLRIVPFLTNQVKVELQAK